MNSILEIAPSAPTDIDKLPPEDLTTLLNHFKNLEGVSSTIIMDPNITEKNNNDIVTLKKELEEKEKEQAKLSELKQYYIDKIIEVPNGLSETLDAVTDTVYKLREALQNANTKCNGILPIWGPDVTESLFSNALARLVNIIIR